MPGPGPTPCLPAEPGQRISELRRCTGVGARGNYPNVGEDRPSPRWNVGQCGCGHRSAAARNDSGTAGDAVWACTRRVGVDGRALFRFRVDGFQGRWQYPRSSGVVLSSSRRVKTGPGRSAVRQPSAVHGAAGPRLECPCGPPARSGWRARRGQPGPAAIRRTAPASSSGSRRRSSGSPCGRSARGSFPRMNALRSPICAVWRGPEDGGQPVGATTR